MSAPFSTAITSQILEKFGKIVVALDTRTPLPVAGVGRTKKFGGCGTYFTFVYVRPLQPEAAALAWEAQRELLIALGITLVPAWPLGSHWEVWELQRVLPRLKGRGQLTERAVA